MSSTLNRPTGIEGNEGPLTVSDLDRNTIGKKGNAIVDLITTTDHKKLGYMYLVSSVVWFCIGGVLALLIRGQLFAPGMEMIATKEQFNQLFTMHGTIMLLMFATRCSLALPTCWCRCRLVPLTLPSRDSTTSPTGCTSTLR